MFDRESDLALELLFAASQLAVLFLFFKKGQFFDSSH